MEKLFDAEYRLMEILWELEPVNSTKLVGVCREKLGWNKSTTYTVLRKICQKGAAKNENATVTTLITREQTIREQGVSKVQTGMGYTFDDEGLKIARTGQQIENLLDNTGMYVTRSGDVILQANADGVAASDVAVHNYLIVGSSRLESYETGRTACFYIGTTG